MSARAADEREADQAAILMREHGASNCASSTAAQQGEGVARLPVVEEELRIGKREVQTGGVRVRQEVSERPVEEQVNLREERVSVERRPVDRPIGDAAAFQERTIEATETSEQAVVAKEARVVEEVVVNKEVEQRAETVRDTVRRTDVKVEKIEPDTKRRPN